MGDKDARSITLSQLRHKAEERAAELTAINAALLTEIAERKRVEKELESSFSLMKAAFDSTADGLLVVDNQGKILQFNQKFLELWRIPAAIIETKDDDQALAFVIDQLQDPEKFLAVVRALYAETEADSFDVLLFKDGRTFERYSQPQKVAGKSEGRVWSFRDITDRKRAETALRQSEALYHDLVETSQDLIWQCDADGRYTYLNPAWEQVFGYRVEEMLGRRFSEFQTPEYAERDLTEFARLLQGNTVKGLETMHIGKDGREIHLVFNAKYIVDKLGNSQGTRGTAYDITERKRVEIALQEKEELFRNLFEHHSAVKLIIDPANGDIIDANAAAAQFYGWTREQLMQMRISEINTLSPEEIQKEMDMAGSQRRIHFEFRHRRADGSLRDVEVFSSKINAQGKNLLHSIVHDITDRKQTEAAKAKLEIENRQLHKNLSLNRMAGAIAHHFNNQLGVVIGNLELAMEDLCSDSRAAKRLTGAMQGAKKAAEVSSQMLTYLGQVAGKHRLLDLSDTCRQILPLLQAATPKYSLLKADLPNPGPSITANANQIQQVLTNLITNAGEALEDNQGTIGLSIKTVTPADISAANRFPINWQPEDKVYACLEVMDSGCGIASEDIGNLFDPFFSSKFQGRGLGLPVALGIVTAHGGAFTVVSTLGQGSIFRVYFPLTEVEIAWPQAEKTCRSYASEKVGTVLLVDDDEMVLEMAESMLKLLGFTVLSAKDGVEAVEIFQNHMDTITVVLCDLSMPRMNGWDTLAALRKIRPGLPVVLASGYNEAQVFADGSREISQVFLHKPYQLSDLKESLEKAMEEVLK